MANSTLLSLFQNTLQGMGVAASGAPATVINNTNQDVVQLLALAHAGGDELSREFDWEQGTIQNIFTATFFAPTGGVVTNLSAVITGLSSTASLDTSFMVTGTGIPQDTFIKSVDSGSQITLNQNATATNSNVTITASKVLYTMPTDFDRMIDRTQWDKSKHWEMLGPSSPQQREWLRSGYISTGPRIRFWKMGGYFQIWPALGATETLSFEYQSKNWIYATAATSVSKTAFTLDTDTSMYPDALMRALLKLKYFEMKGFDTTAVFRDYMMHLNVAKAADSPRPMLNMAPRPASALIGWENIPDSNYGT